MNVFMLTEVGIGLTMGLAIGLLGAGGSILSVPVLTYVVGLDPKIAVASALVIVGLSSGFATILNLRSGLLHFKKALVFLACSSPMAFVGAKISIYLSGDTQLLIFAGLMLLASFSLFRKPIEHQKDHSPLLIFLVAAWVGFLTGLIGIGGAFMLVPALVVILNFKMKEAIANTQFLVAMNAAIGFGGHLGRTDFPWNQILPIFLFAACGVALGLHFQSKVSAEKLRRAFAFVVLFLGFFMIYRSLASMI